MAAAKVDSLIAVGEREAELIHRQARAAGVASMLVADRVAALEVLRQLLRPGDLVLVKGSHATGLAETAEQLCAFPTAVR